MPYLLADDEQYKKLSKIMQDNMGVDLRDYRIDVDQWKKFNEMRNTERPMSATMTEVRVEPKLTVYFMESARNCIIKHVTAKQRTITI